MQQESWRELLDKWPEGVGGSRPLVFSEAVALRLLRELLRLEHELWFAGLAPAAELEGASLELSLRTRSGETLSTLSFAVKEPEEVPW